MLIVNTHYSLAAIYLMLENYRKELICIKYSINYKKNQDVKPKQI